jgi:predicted Holliday junction resolvase-like endonuclease
MALLDYLKKEKRLRVRLPCGHDVAASKAAFFDATKPLPKAAIEKLGDMRAEIADLRDDLAKQKANVTQRARVAARAVNIGKVVEKIAPSLAGFPVRADECRSLFEPIDYVVFRGLATGRVDALEFVDVKSGHARLNDSQRSIREAVEAGKVSLFVEAKRGGA